MIRKLMTLTLIITLSLLTGKANANTSNAVPKVTVKEYIVKHSMEMGIDPALALSIAKMESEFCHEKKNPSGAVGVFQLMPSTARRLGFNPYYVNENIKGGLTYYKMMYQKFGSVELALAAYNAGPGNVAKYKGIPPFRETKTFISNIMAEYHKQKANPDPIINQVKTKKEQQVVKPVEETQKVQTGTPEPETQQVTEEQTPVAENIISMNTNAK